MALTSAALAKIKQQLLQRRKELKDVIQHELFKAGHEGLAGEVHDRSEESLADLLMDLNVAIAELDTRELNDIRMALDQIEAGSYGVCIDCGADIAAARLESQPAAVRCIDCQEMFEVVGVVGTSRL